MRLLAGAFLLLLANSAYLAARADASLFYFANVAIHAVLGFVVVALVFTRRSRRSGRAKNKLPDLPDLPVITRVLFHVMSLLLAIASVLGVALLFTGATTQYRWLLHAHIATAVAGALVALGRLIGAVSRQGVRTHKIAAGVAALVLVAAGGAAAFAAIRHEAVRRAEYRIVNPHSVPDSMDGEGAGPSSPFFPSSANTARNGIIPANFFLTSQACGRCHKDIYDQWNSSMHHFSSFNNQWYRKSIEYMQDVVGTRPSKWCAGCHDHAVFFNGRFDTPIREQIDTPEAQAGLACTSCHAITKVNSTMGQGDFVVEYPPLHDLATSENRLLQFVHDRLLYLDPQPHRETFLKPFHREQTPEFCASCHKVHLDVPVNAYRWFRGFNDYDNWQASGVSGEGARSFYYPPRPQRCADCHMPPVPSTDPAAKNGLVKSHRFATANTAVPFVNGDTAQLEEVQKFLRDGQISVDIFGLVRDPAPPAAAARRAVSDPQLASSFAVGEESVNFGATLTVVQPAPEVLAPLDRVGAWVRPGESVRIEVVVRTRKVGHFFPGGTVDAFDVWVEFEAIDESGRVLLHSGRLEEAGGPVEPGAHFYRALLLDERGNPINKRNAWAARAVAYVRLVPPGAADTIHYRLDVPNDVRGRVRLRARVQYRKFAWFNTQWAYAGVRDPAQPSFSLAPGHDDGRFVFTGDTSAVSGAMKKIPDLPITTMADTTVMLKVAAAGADVQRTPSVTDAASRERWNDYGIGLLLQGDLKGAEAAFLKVTTIDPTYADGWVNVGRARLQEGNLPGAEDVLRRALAVDATLAKTHFFLGTVLKNSGRYDESLHHLREAATQYPRDRVVRNQIGRVLFLMRRFPEAVSELSRVLEIDPEDLSAHYNLMLCYQGLGRQDDAERERKLYERFKADESSQAITGPFRQLNPHDNNERQAIHEHK
jgi:Flp pilus assembly protein TadD